MMILVSSLSLAENNSFLFDTTMTYRPAPRLQSYPSIVFDGTDYFLVWHDLRNTVHYYCYHGVFCFRWNLTNGHSWIRWEGRSRNGRRFGPEKKVEILREHLKNKVPISELCQKYGLHPNLLHRLEKELFDGGVDIFSGWKGFLTICKKYCE